MHLQIGWRLVELKLAKGYVMLQDTFDAKLTFSIHVKERNAIFPFPESCPFFSESERKAGLIWKGRKGTGKERYDGPKFPFLSISDFPI